MTSPMYFRISSAVAMGALVHGLKRYPNVYRSLSERMPGYLCHSHVPPKLSNSSKATNGRVGALRPGGRAPTPLMPAPTMTTSKCSVRTGAVPASVAVWLIVIPSTCTWQPEPGFLAASRRDTFGSELNVPRRCAVRPCGTCGSRWGRSPR